MQTLHRFSGSVGYISESSTQEEFSPEVSDTNIDPEFNQELEEELLDIPTFLRRQAN